MALPISTVTIPKELLDRLTSRGYSASNVTRRLLTAFLDGRVDLPAEEKQAA